MIRRFIEDEVRDLLGQFPAVALLGPRQIGKTTLARQIGETAGALSAAWLGIDRVAAAE
jgi:hypothetical protein